MHGGYCRLYLLYSSGVYILGWGGVHRELCAVTECRGSTPGRAGNRGHRITTRYDGTMRLSISSRGGDVWRNAVKVPSWVGEALQSALPAVKTWRSALETRLAACWWLIFFLRPSNVPSPPLLQMTCSSNESCDRSVLFFFFWFNRLNHAKEVWTNLTSAEVNVTLYRNNRTALQSSLLAR